MHSNLCIMCLNLSNISEIGICLPSVLSDSGYMVMWQSGESSRNLLSNFACISLSVLILGWFKIGKICLWMSLEEHQKKQGKRNTVCLSAWKSVATLDQHLRTDKIQCVLCVCVCVFSMKSLIHYQAVLSALRTQLHFLKCYSNGLTLQGYKVKMKKRIFLMLLFCLNPTKWKTRTSSAWNSIKEGSVCCVLAVLVQMHGTGSERRRLHD